MTRQLEGFANLDMMTEMVLDVGALCLLDEFVASCSQLTATANSLPLDPTT
jgi:hypothetical protein